MNLKSLLPFLVIGLSIGLYFVYIGPTWTEISTLQAKKAQYATVLERSKDIKEKRDNLVAAYGSISEADIAKLNKIIPAKFNAILLANDLNFIATKNSVVIKDFKNNDQTPGGIDGTDESGNVVYRSHNISVSVTGDFPQFMQFIKDIESSLQLMDITNISIKSLTGETTANSKVKPGSLTYSIEFQTYSLQ